MNYSQCWLNYNPIDNYEDRDMLSDIGICIATNQISTIIENAVSELSYALKRMLNINCNKEYMTEDDQYEELKSGIILRLNTKDKSGYNNEGYSIKHIDKTVRIEAETESGILYGCFDLIRRIAQGELIRGIDIMEKPKNNIRILNHWDNMDGSIERGYSGKSFFFKNDELIINERTRDYARLISSVGINATVINNVNVHGAASDLITDRYLDKLRIMADIFAGYNIRLFLSANFALY